MQSPEAPDRSVVSSMTRYRSMMETSSSSELSDLHMKYLYAPLFWEDAEVQQKIALCLPCARPLKQCEPICKNPHGRPYDDGNFTGVFMVLFVDEEQETEFKYFIQDTEWLQPITDKSSIPSKSWTRSGNGP